MQLVVAADEKALRPTRSAGCVTSFVCHQQKSVTVRSTKEFNSASLAANYDDELLF